MADTKKPQTIWVLSIQNTKGTELYHFSNQNAAINQLHEYVKDFWDTFFDDLSMPENKLDAIDEFFSGSDANSYVLYQDELLDEAYRD